MNIESIWPLVRLDTIILDMQPGFARRPNPDGSGFPQLRTNNISDEGNIDLSLVRYVNASTAEQEKYSVKRGDVVFNNTNSPVLVGRTALFDLDEVYLLSNHMTRLRVNDNLILAPFLARYLHYLWMIGYSQSRAKQWVNQAAVDQRQLSRFSVPLPPLFEQHRIVDILRQADDLRCLRSDADARMTDLQTSLFEAMFGTLVEAQKDWPIERLKKLGKVEYGLTVNQERRNAGNKHPYLRVGNVYRWQLDLSEMETIGTLDGDIEKYTLSKGDVLVVEGHANPKELGRASVWNGEIQGCLHQNHILRVRPNTSKITSNYLMGFINSALGQHHMLRYGKTSSGLYTINSTDLAKIPIVRPPMELQLEFERRYAAYKVIDKQLSNIADRLNDLFTSLLARAFTGELTTAWREEHAAQLHDEAVQRDIALGERPTRPRLLDFEIGLVTQKEREEFTSQMQAIFAPAVEGLVQAMTPSLQWDKILNIEPLIDLGQLVTPLQPQFKDLINTNMYQGIHSLTESTRSMLASSIQPFLEIDEAYRVALAPIQQTTLQIAEQLVRFANLATRRPDENHLRYHSLTELSDKQYWLYLDATRSFENYFTLGDLCGDDNWEPDFAQRTLTLLEKLGLVIRVSVPSPAESDSLEYVVVYRAVQEADDSRITDLDQLREKYPELRV